jgi:chemotaxis protein methyltransferase CheR
MDLEVARMSEAVSELEMTLLLEAIYGKFHYDFRSYSRASLRRRLERALVELGCASLSRLQEQVLHSPDVFPALLDLLTIKYTDMFRDPRYFRAIRERVVPILKTYPSLRIWIAGCSTGEEAYAIAVLLREEDLLDRTTLYATDINPSALRAAERGIYDLERIAQFTRNHQQSGARSSLSDHYTAAYDAAVMDRSLAAHMVFADHSLATDSAFAEMQLISCRNVLIYFDRALQDRALGLFRESLCHKGFLGLGAKESLRFSKEAWAFSDVAYDERIYQRR